MKNLKKNSNSGSKKVVKLGIGYMPVVINNNNKSSPSSKCMRITRTKCGKMVVLQTPKKGKINVCLETHPTLKK